jgi:hypothetical protein
MEGGILQLAVKGREDVHLTSEPEFSYYETVYKKHTNFSIQNNIYNLVGKKFGQKMEFKILKGSDLLNCINLEVNLPKIEENITTKQIEETIIDYEININSLKYYLIKKEDNNDISFYLIPEYIFLNEYGEMLLDNLDSYKLNDNYFSFLINNVDSFYLIDLDEIKLLNLKTNVSEKMLLFNLKNNSFSKNDFLSTSKIYENYEKILNDIIFNNYDFYYEGVLSDKLKNINLSSFGEVKNYYYKLSQDKNIYLGENIESYENLKNVFGSYIDFINYLYTNHFNYKFNVNYFMDLNFTNVNPSSLGDIISVFDLIDPLDNFITNYDKNYNLQKEYEKKYYSNRNTIIQVYDNINIFDKKSFYLNALSLTKYFENLNSFPLLIRNNFYFPNKIDIEINIASNNLIKITKTTTNKALYDIILDMNNSYNISPNTIEKNANILTTYITFLMDLIELFDNNNYVKDIQGFNNYSKDFIVDLSNIENVDYNFLINNLNFLPQYLTIKLKELGPLVFLRNKIISLLFKLIILAKQNLVENENQVNFNSYLFVELRNVLTLRTITDNFKQLLNNSNIVIYSEDDYSDKLNKIDRSITQNVSDFLKVKIENEITIINNSSGIIDENGFYIVKVNFEPISYINYYYNNLLLEYFRDNGFFFKFREYKKEYIIKEVYERSVPYVEIDYGDISLNKFEMSKYEKLQDCKIRKYLIYDKNIDLDLINNNKIKLNLEKETYFIDVSNNVEFLSKKISYDFESKFYLLRCEKDEQVFFKKINYLGFDDGLIIDENILDKNLYSKIELQIFNSIFIDIKFDEIYSIPKPILFRNITNKILENYNFDELNYLYKDIHFGIDLASNMESVNISDLYKLIDIEFLNMANSFKLLSLKKDEYYIYGTIDGIKGYYYPIYLTDIDARLKDINRIAIEKTILEYDFKIYVAKNNFNFSSDLNDIVKSYKFIEIIENSINVKLNRSNDLTDLSLLDNFEIEVINNNGLEYNRLRIYHNRKLPNLMNLTSSSISESPKDVVYDYFIQQPSIIRLKNTNNYLITNLGRNTGNIYINDKIVINLCKIESNQLLRNNFSKISFNFDEDILLVSKDEIINIYNNLLDTKYSFLENIDNVINLMINNEKYGLELIKNSSDLIRTVIDVFSDRFINVSDNILKYNLDFNNETMFNIFDLDVSNIALYQLDLINFKEIVNLPWLPPLNINNRNKLDLDNVRDYLINNVELLINNENLLNKYNSSNIDLKLIENYQINFNQIEMNSDFLRVELYNKPELNISFLEKIIYNNKNLNYNLDLENNTLFLKKEDINETDFYRYSTDKPLETVDLNFLTIKENKIAKLIINEPIFSIIIDDNNKYVKIDDISYNIFNPRIFNINKESIAMNESNYFKKIIYLLILGNLENLSNNIYLIKNIGLLIVKDNYIYILSINELFEDMIKKIIVKLLSENINEVIINLENLDLYYNNNSNEENILNLNGEIKYYYKFYNIYYDNFNLESYFIYYENGSHHYFSIGNLILFNINNKVNIDKIILVEKDKINLLSSINIKNQILNLDVEYFSEKYIFTRNLLNLVEIDNNNYNIYQSDYQDFYLNLDVDLIFDLSDNSNYLLINNDNTSLIGGFIYYNDIYWKLTEIENDKIKSLRYNLINPINNNNINEEFKIRLPIFTNDKYNYRFNTGVEFKNNYNLSWNYLDGLNLNLDVSFVKIKIDNNNYTQSVILTKDNGYYKFSDDIYKRIKFIDTSYNIERVFTIINNQEDFIFDISYGLENNLISSGSYIYLDNSNEIVNINTNNKISNFYTDNILFKLSLVDDYTVRIKFDYENLNDSLNSGTIFILKESGILNYIYLVVYKNEIYDRLDLKINGNSVIEPFNLLSTNIINIIDLSINFNEDILEINDSTSLKIKTHTDTYEISYKINGIYDNINNYKIFNVLSYDLTFIGFLNEVEVVNNEIILKTDNNFIVGYDENFILNNDNIEVYKIEKQVYYNYSGYIDTNNFLYLYEGYILDDMILKINNNFYYVVESYGNICKVKLSNVMDINELKKYPIYFDKLIIMGRFIKNSYNYLEHLLHEERNNLFGKIENVNLLNRGDYFIKDNSLNIYENQDISNCFGSTGNFINVRVFKNMVYFKNTFLLDLKILDRLYDVSANYEEYKVERIMENVILLNKEISNVFSNVNLYVPFLNYELVKHIDLSNNEYLIEVEADYGLIKRVKLGFEFKTDLCVNWYNNSPNRYSNKVKFNRIDFNTYQLEDPINLSLSKLDFYYNQVLGVCKDFSVVDYVLIKDFDLSTNIIKTDVDISLDLLFVFNSNKLLKDELFVNLNNYNNINYIVDVKLNPLYNNFIYERVNLIVFYMVNLNSFSTNFIIDLYYENNFYKFRSEELFIYENSYYFNNENVLYVIDGLNLVRLVKESNFVFRIESINLNPNDLAIITEYYENNQFMTMIILENNRILSNIKVHSNKSKFYVNNLFEIKIKNNKLIEFQRPSVNLINNFRDIKDNYLFVFSINIRQKQPIFDTIINKFLVEIDFIQDYEDITIESLLLYKIYLDENLENILKLIKKNGKIYVETDKLLNYSKIYIVQNNQLKIFNDFSPINNTIENNLLKNTLFLHQSIEIEWYGILRNYIVKNPRLELLNKNIDVNKPYNPVVKVYEDNKNIIIETLEKLSNIPNITNQSYIIDIYQNVIVNNFEILTYSTINNFYFIKLDLDILYKLSRDNKKLLDNLSLFKNTKNVRFEYINGSIVIDDISSVFLEEEIFYYEVIVSNDVISGLADELREMAIIILDTIEKYNNFGFWITWKQVLEFKLNQYGFTIKENCLHKLTEDLYVISELSDFIKTDNGYVRKNGITLDIDLIYDTSDNFYILRRDKGKLNNFVDDVINGKTSRYGINIDLLLNNIDSITHSFINNDVDINYNYKNEFKSLNQLYLEYLWNKYKNDEIYSNINPNLDFGSDNNKLFRYEIDLNLLDEDRLDTTDIKIYNENIIEDAIVFNKKVIFFENDLNTDTLTLSTYVRYKIENVEFIGNYYRIDMNNNTFDENLRIKLGEDFIDLLEIDDRVMYVASKDISNIEHIEYVNNIYVKNGSLYVKDYNSSFTFQKSYIFDGNNVYFIPNNYQNSKIYFYCKEFGIRLGLNYNLDLSKNNIDYQVKINVVIVNNRYVFDTSLNNFEKGKIYLFDQSHISNKNYPLKIAKDLSFNDHYYNSYGLAGDNKVIYFAPVELGKVYIYSESKNQENVINNPYDFGFNINGIDIIDGSENIVEVDVSVDIINRVYVLSNQNYETGKIYKFNILNFVKNNFGLSLNLYYLYKGDTYIPIILDDKLINASNSLIIDSFNIYELIEVKGILNIVDLNKIVYKINSELIDRNQDYISSNVEENIFVESDLIIRPFKVYLNSYSEFIVMLDTSDNELKNIIHFSNLNQSLPLNVNSIELKNKIYYDIYINDNQRLNLISNESKIILNDGSNNIIGKVENNQFIIESDKYLELNNEMIINNIYKTEYRTDISNVYLKIPNELLLTFVSDYDLRYIIVDNSNIIIDYSGLLLIDISNILFNEIKISKTDISFVDDMDLYLNQYVRYTGFNKLFDKSEFFNEILVNPFFEVDYDSYVIEIRNNPDFDYIYSIDLSNDLVNFNYYTDKIYVMYNDNKLKTLDFIYLDLDNLQKLIVGSNINIYNINKLLINNQIYDINNVFSIKKQFRGKYINNKFLIDSDFINFNSNYLNSNYKLKISGFNKIDIKNNFNNEEILINKQVNKTEIIETKLVERNYINDVVFRLFKKIGFYINDELIEELTPDIYQMIYNFHYRKDQKENILKLRKDGDNFKFSLPLEFWFKKNHLNLPLIAMNNTDLYLKIELEDVNKLIDIPINYNPNIKINVDIDTILLDDKERTLFGSKGHEYIIERYVDYQNYRLNKLQSVNRIPLKGLIKNIYWFGYNYTNNDVFISSEIIENEEKYQEYLDLINRYNLYLENKLPYENDFAIISKNKKLLIIGNNVVNAIKNSNFLKQFDIEFILFLYEKYINPKNNIKSIINKLNLYFVHLYYSKKIIKKEPIMKEINIKINGTTLFGKRDNLYYNNVLPNKNLTTIPDDNYYFTSFALHPEEHQPSGHLNFNKLDEFVIISNNDERVLNQAYQLRVIVKEYQIIRIIGGMSSLMW